MSYLLTQMWLLMLGAFLLGLLLGWIFWGQLKQQLTKLTGDIQNLRSERDQLKTSLDACELQKAQYQLAGPVVSPVGKDNLRRLIGIGPTNERILNNAGITTFAQIAAWTPGDVAEIERTLQFGGRVERENWVEQARLIAAGKEDEYISRFPTSVDDTNT